VERGGVGERRLRKGSSRGKEGTEGFLKKEGGLCRNGTRRVFGPGRGEPSGQELIAAEKKTEKYLNAKRRRTPESGKEKSARTRRGWRTRYDGRKRKRSPVPCSAGIKRTATETGRVNAGEEQMPKQKPEDEDNEKKSKPDN